MKHSKPGEVASLRDEVTALKREVSTLSKSTIGNRNVCCHKGDAVHRHEQMDEWRVH